MNAIPVTGHVNEDHSLSAIVPESVPPGPVTIFVVPAQTTDEADAAWMPAVAREWAAELSDVREDVYSLEDGAPVNEA